MLDPNLIGVYYQLLSITTQEIGDAPFPPPDCERTVRIRQENLVVSLKYAGISRIIIQRSANAMFSLTDAGALVWWCVLFKLQDFWLPSDKSSLFVAAELFNVESAVRYFQKLR